MYAVATGSALQHGNELMVIDVEKRIVEASVLIGSDPDSLALSDDASTLWVGLHGALSIREVDLTQWPPKPGAQYALPDGQFSLDAVHARDMVVLPGQPRSVAVSLHYDGLSPSFAGLVVIDAGNPRPSRTPGHTGAAQLTSGPPGYLFGFNNLHTGFEFYSIAVDAMGVKQSEHDGLIDGFSSDIAYDDGYVIATSGEVIDVQAPDMPVRAGTFAFNGLVIPHVASSRVLMLSSTSASSSFVLRELNLESFREDREVPLAGRFASVADFVEVKPGLFAFRELPMGSFGTAPSGAKLHIFSAPDFAE